MTAQLGTIDANSANGAYAQSFGNLPHGYTYSDPAGLKSGFAQDIRKDLQNAFEVGMKAHNTSAGGAGTAGFAMIPVYLDPRIVDLTRKFTPLVEMVPRVTNQGMYADWNQLTVKGGAFAAAEDAALSETSTTYDRQSVQMKFLYSVGRVTGPSIAAQPSFILAGLTSGSSGLPGSVFSDASAPNALQQEVLVKTRELRELEENLIINGDASVNALEFSGLIKQIGATNTVDKNTGALALVDIDAAVKNAFDDGGRPNLAICSSGVYTDLLALLNAKIGYLQSAKQVFWGFSAIVLNTMVGEIPVVPSMYMSNTTGSKAIYFLDMSVIEMRVLQDVMYEELAKTNDSRKFMLKVYEALVVKNAAFCASVTEIS